MSKRAGTVITLDDLIERARRGRRPVRADPLLGGHHAGPRPGPVDPADQRQPGVLRAVRARPAGLAGPQRRRPGHRPCRTRCDPALLDTPRESRADRAARPRTPRSLATAAELREPHRVARYLEDLASGYHKFYDTVRVLPMGDEPTDRAHRRPARGCARPPGRCWPTAWPCSASAPRSGCEGAPGRTAGTPAGPLHADPGTAGAAAAPPRRRPERARPAVWPRHAARGRRRRARAGRRRRARSGRALTAPR